MAPLTLRGIEKRFGNTVAVQDLNLQVGDGEFFALLGPSGCGKTTTMRMIAGLEAPSAGRIQIGERDVTGLPPAERNVGMVFQDYALYPHMSVQDNIGYPLKVRGVRGPTYAERVSAVAEQLQLGPLLGRRPGQLSGGQQQRVAVSRAVVHHADVFLFDEPLSNLDAKLRLEARAFLKRLQRELKMTVVYVTHDQVEALALADRLAVMQGGVVQQVGAPLDVYRRPATTFVASFIGNPPMNLLPVTLESAGRWRCGDSLLRPHTPRPDLAGRSLTLGLRPEHLRPDPAGELSGEVLAVEPLGAETILMLKTAGETVAVRLPGEAEPPGSGRVTLQPEWGRAVLFDERGVRL
ncbi:ABC transporter ATP-binding protein (plasmid) [Deinococcus metallilatus]|uniref:ABC transporter ATP-binding protein n=2 Tax=Deinococcus metallilatus TaxID=1211322 RepID=A0AAJ5F7P0_9DEIO|nr:ABC transporter ATP-binding protein [Deinococcus metallilatus]MBB5295678.1 ABC-type sugar transport system ATPase subunit [Deinococcus metallilatus]QBY06867.1 ABC transporter ATP-binding protein [Deinococcus metallilatus]TLK32256.1 ABC transporter ATP-binding protein [Deinococcus metallilatus]GMA14207.1 sn-glycerol-3-phosphate ABC transporter ATP-binding protein [Deinococcus metallilatus]